MSAAAATADPNRIGNDGSERTNTGSGTGGPAPRRIVVGYGFWIFLLSDIIMFAAFFAAYAVLSGATAGGPDAKQLFDLDNTAIETGCLLLSSFTMGMASLAVLARRMMWAQVAFTVTGLLGLSFLALETREFHDLIERGAGPDRSAFLSAFFALVGTHGLHVGAGLLWIGTMMAQLRAKGFRADTLRRILCLSLFWHALDIVWVALFTIVYLMGAR
jgi:cytochrome o ubiquinol oxidase subunit 3